MKIFSGRRRQARLLGRSKGDFQKNYNYIFIPITEMEN